MWFKTVTVEVTESLSRWWEIGELGSVIGGRFPAVFLLRNNCLLDLLSIQFSYWIVLTSSDTSISLLLEEKRRKEVGFRKKSKESAHPWPFGNVPALALRPLSRRRPGSIFSHPFPYPFLFSFLLLRAFRRGTWGSVGSLCDRGSHGLHSTNFCMDLWKYFSLTISIPSFALFFPLLSSLFL